MANGTIMLTTIDNPFNPFTQFNEWYIFDTSSGYDSCGLLSRVAHTSPELTEDENNQLIAEAIAEILKYDLTHKYTAIHNTPI